MLCSPVPAGIEPEAQVGTECFSRVQVLVTMRRESERDANKKKEFWNHEQRRCIGRQACTENPIGVLESIDENRSNNFNSLQAPNKVGGYQRWSLVQTKLTAHGQRF